MSRLLAVGSAGGLGAVALLLLLAPSGLGVAPHVVVMKAPYKGVIQNNFLSVSNGGCGSGKITAPPKWTSATGHMSFAMASKAPLCKTSPAGNYGYSDAGIALYIPIQFAKNGPHSVVENWTITAAIAAVLNMGTCTITMPTGTSYSYASCYQDGSASIYGYTYIIDASNGTYFYSSNYWSGIYNNSYNDTYSYCYSGTCYNSSYAYSYSNGMSPAQVSWFFNGTFAKSHHYWMEIELYGYADASLSSYAYGGATAVLVGGSASGSVDMATGGNGATLNSITIT